MKWKPISSAPKNGDNFIGSKIIKLIKRLFCKKYIPRNKKYHLRNEINLTVHLETPSGKCYQANNIISGHEFYHSKMTKEEQLNFVFKRIAFDLSKLL